MVRKKKRKKKWRRGAAVMVVVVIVLAQVPRRGRLKDRKGIVRRHSRNYVPHPPSTEVCHYHYYYHHYYYYYYYYLILPPSLPVSQVSIPISIMMLDHGKLNSISKEVPSIWVALLLKKKQVSGLS